MLHLFALIALASFSYFGAYAQDPVVVTSLGEVEGSVVNVGQGVHSFLGIPYAAPPVGKLRFAKPIPVSPWTGTRKMTKAYGNYCIQPLRPGNEDCLFLNIWTPANRQDSQLLPVMVYIFGGGFTFGDGNINGSMLSSFNYVIVSFNY